MPNSAKVYWVWGTEFLKALEDIKMPSGKTKESSSEDPKES